MNKRELMDKLTDLEIKLNGITLTWFFKRCIEPELFNDLMELSDDIAILRNEIKEGSK